MGKNKVANLDSLNKIQNAINAGEWNGIQRPLCKFANRQKIYCLVF